MADEGHRLVSFVPPPLPSEQRQLQEEQEATELLDEASDGGGVAYYLLDRQSFDDHRTHVVDEQIRRSTTLGLLARAHGFDFHTFFARLQEANGGGGRFGAVPASAAAVAGLEKLTFHAAEGCGGGGVVTDCAICLEEFEDGEEVSVMPCSRRHEFHAKCITKWLGRSNTCPLCRHELPAGVDDN